MKNKKYDTPKFVLWVNEINDILMISGLIDDDVVPDNFTPLP